MKGQDAGKAAGAALMQARPPASKGKHKVVGMRIRKAHGGYIATHERVDEDDHPVPDYEGARPEHVLADKKALHEHIDKHFHDGSQ